MSNVRGGPLIFTKGPTLILGQKNVTCTYMKTSKTSHVTPKALPNRDPTKHSLAQIAILI